MLIRLVWYEVNCLQILKLRPFETLNLWVVLPHVGPMSTCNI